MIGAVVGPAGVGKTTVITSVLMQPEVRRAFAAVVYLRVGRNPDIVLLLKELERQLGSSHRAPLRCPEVRELS
jgi:adenylate kinase